MSLSLVYSVSLNPDNDPLEEGKLKLGFEPRASPAMASVLPITQH